MTATIEIKVPFVAPVGTPGVLQLLQECPTSKKALLSIDLEGSGDGRHVCVSLTSADMRKLVDGMMDAIQAIERHERLFDDA